MRSSFPLVAALALATPAHAAPGDQIHKLQVTGHAGEGFGSAVAIDGINVVVGTSRLRTEPFGSRVGGAYLIDASTGAILQMLLANDGADFDGLGTSVAISGNRVILGAPGADVGDTDTGAAYLFDATTGQQLFKLTANDGQASDFFGASVAISGTTAVVGAPYDDDIDNISGAVYLFDTATGQQTAKIYASDGQIGDYFGSSVAISDGVIIVGAIHDDDNGVNSGSAYLFDAATGAQLSKLVSVDGVEKNRAGYSVAISGTTAIVGAPSFPGLDLGEGLVHVYDVSDPTLPVQFTTLVSSEAPGTDNGFGISVGLSGDTAIVGAVLPDVSQNTDSGLSYLFDVTTGQEIVKLSPTDLPASNEFGFAVAISGPIAVSASPATNTTLAGVYLFEAPDPLQVDTDGDGLLDDWEENGVPWTDSNGVEQRFEIPFADKDHKDIYIEVDAMTGFTLSAAAGTMVFDAFWASPLENPDGFPGVNLYVMHDEDDLPHIAEWAVGTCWPLDFDFWRSQFFGTEAERGMGDDSEALLEAKAKVYRYCIMADKSGPGPDKKFGGCELLGGDNFVIFKGNSTTDESIASKFMHELGHTLNLDHGGGDGVNGKPNYPSIMNYSMAYKAAWNSSFWKLDYSRAEAGTLAALNENSLNELAGIGSPGGYYSGYKMPYGVNVLDVSGNPTRAVRYVTLDGSIMDFGDAAGTQFEDALFDVSVVQDLNYLIDPPSGIVLPTVESLGDNFNPHDDWGNVQLPLLTARGAAAPAATIPTGELTENAADWMAANFPIPPGACQADQNGDGILDNGDIQTFVTLFLGGGLVTDLNGDGILDNGDIQVFVALFLAGC